MFGPFMDKAKTRCGLVIDIGSASVALAIVVSKSDQAKPDTVWSYVERSPIQDTFDVTNGASHIISTLITACEQAGNKGLRTLASAYHGLQITDVLISISAPWSYTLPQTVTYKQPEAFVVSRKLLEDLNHVAEEKAVQNTVTMDMYENLNLSQINSSVTSILANGYSIDNPLGKTACELVMTKNITLVQQSIVEIVRKIHDRVLGKSRLTINSFLQQMQQSLRTQPISHEAYGLIDISGEATEVGIVTAGHLTNVVSNTSGINSLARSLARATGEPPISAFTKLYSSSNGVIQDITTAQQRSWKKAAAVFSEDLSKLIRRSCTDVETPKHFYIHTDTSLQPLMIALARKGSSLSEDHVAIVPISKQLADFVSISETRLSVSVAVFHTT